MVFQVFGDTTKLYDSGVMTGATATKSVSVDLTGKTSLGLVITNGGDNVDYDHGDWADAKLTCGGAPPPDTTPPTVTAVSPTDAATGVAVGTTATATFSEAIDPATVSTSTVTLAKAGTAVAATVTYDAASKTATLHPSATLDVATTYTATVKGGASGVKDLAANALAADKVWTFTTAAAAGGTTSYVSDLTWTSMTNGWGPVEKDKSNGEQAAGDGHTLTLNGTTFAKGLGGHAASDVRYALNSCTSFTAQVGIDDEVGANGSVVFQVFGDTTKLYDSGVMTGATATKSVSVDLTGKTSLGLVITNGGDNVDYDHGDWADAKLTCGATPPPPPGTIYGPPTSYPSGANTHGITLADINGDGKRDLVAANAGSNNVGVRLGNGDGTFGALATFGVGFTPKMVAVGDFNGDGKPDLVTANQDAATVSVLIGNGTGGFAAATSYATCLRPHGVAIGDLNGDGKQDLAVACFDTTLVSVLLGNGDGTFAAAVSYSAGSNPHSVVIGDFNADGKQDLAIANHGSANVSVLYGVGDGTFGAPVNYGVGTGPHSIAAADLNGDGKIDLATANDGSDTVSVLLADSEGGLQPALSFATGHVPKGIAIGDVNNDGKLDLVTANTGGNYPGPPIPGSGGDTVTVLLGNGDGTFGSGTPYQVGPTAFSVALADLDGDTDLDLATANWHSNDVTVLKNLTLSSALPPDTTPPTVTARSRRRLALRPGSPGPPPPPRSPRRSIRRRSRRAR